MKATEVTAVPAESNGSLLPGIWRGSLHVTCGLTACTSGSAPGPTLDNEMGKLYPFYPSKCYASYVGTAQRCTNLSSPEASQELRIALQRNASLQDVP